MSDGKKPFYKKGWFWAAAGVFALGGVFTAIEESNKPLEATTNTSWLDYTVSETVSLTAEPSDLTDASTSTEISTSTEVSTTVSVSETEEAVTAEHRTGKNFVGVSDKDISEIFSTEYSTVRNDNTGRWKCIVIAESDFDVSEYALSCYKNYFDSDDTVLAVVNLTTKVSTNISYGSGLLYVSNYEYVDGEEHDAVLMFSGTHLNDFIVYADNGDVEKISEEDDIWETEETEPTETSTVTEQATEMSTTVNPVSETEQAATWETVGNQKAEKTYVLNTNTMKIHKPSCSSVKDIKPENYAETNDYDAAISQGYEPCGRCHPY